MIGKGSCQVGKNQEPSELVSVLVLSSHNASDTARMASPEQCITRHGALLQAGSPQSWGLVVEDVGLKELCVTGKCSCLVSPCLTLQVLLAEDCIYLQWLLIQMITVPKYEV